jgi:hypothetical protein
MREAVRRSLLAFLAIAALACHRKPLNEYPKEVVDNFLAACRSNGASDAACECALDGLRNRFTADEYVALEKKVQGKDEAAARVLSEVVADCRD